MARELLQSGGTKHKIKSLDYHFRQHRLPGKRAERKLKEKLFPRIDPKERALYVEAKKSGYSGTFKEWKKEYLKEEK